MVPRPKSHRPGEKGSELRAPRPHAEADGERMGAHGRRGSAARGSPSYAALLTFDDLISLLTVYVRLIQTIQLVAPQIPDAGTPSAGQPTSNRAARWRAERGRN